MALTTTELAAVLAAIYFSYVLAHNAFFHPLRKYPGPRTWALSRIPYAYACATGQGHRKILELHVKYGSIVRVAPNELSFCSPEAWQEIFGRRNNATGEIGKDSVHYAEAADSILGAPKAKHAKLRAILSRGFSNRAMLDQEPLIQGHVKLLFKGLDDHEITKGKETPVDLTKWFDFVALDIITDLGFGESFHSLETGQYHPWATIFLDSLRSIAFATAMKRFQLVFKLLLAFAPKSVMQKHQDMVDLTNSMVDKRLRETDRPDFVGAMSQSGKTSSEPALTLQEIKANAQILTMAGYDTTATALSGVTYLLATHPEIMAKVVEEIHLNFKDCSEISILGTQNLTFMTAVIDETMRLYPPGGSGTPREVPHGGDLIFGQHVPAGTVLTVWQYAMYHNPDNFSHPESFIPDRWLGDENFARDRKDAFQPFSFGARNCIGRNLAYAELRIILAKLLWKFELQLASESQNWLEEQNQYLLWERGPLRVKLCRKTLHD